MAYGQPSWIARTLVGDDLASSVATVEARTVTYGSTAGPFSGIGGAAMSNFDIALLTLRGGEVLVYADTRLLGWAAREGATAVRYLFENGRLTDRHLSRPPASLQSLLSPVTASERNRLSGR